jgi:hypothetical protein
MPLSATNREENGARLKRFCASKQCGKPITADKSVNNNLPSGSIAHAVDVLKMNMSSPIQLKPFLASVAILTAKRPSCRLLS